MVDFLSQLIKFKTASQNPKDEFYPTGIKDCISFLEKTFDQMGIKSKKWLAKPMSFAEHPVLFGALKGIGGGSSVALNGHIDVVPVGDLSAWSHDPWSGETSDGKIWGRGTADMKGGVSAMIQALKIIQKCDFELRGDVFFHLVSDEEVVGFGSRQCVEKLPRPDFVIVTEPTNLNIAPVEGGLEHLRIEIKGVESHAAKRFASIYPQKKDAKDPGINAIEKGIKIIKAIQELENDWALSKHHPLLPPGFNTILPGYIAGGPGGGKDGKLIMISNPGTTPSYCAIEYNIFYYPHESIDEIKNEIENCISCVCESDSWLKNNSPKLTWQLRNISFPPVNTDSNHPILNIFKKSCNNLACSAKVEGANFVCDLAWYSENGIPGVVFGPGDISQAHSPNEFVTIDNYLKSVAILALSILEWCGYKEKIS